MGQLRRGACVLLLAAATPAWGAIEDYRYYSGLLGSYSLPDNARGLDPGWGGQWVIATRLSPGAFLEMNIFGHTQDFEANTARSLDAFGVGLDFALYTESSDLFRPFLLAGAGSLREEDDTSDVGSLYLDVGVGALVGLSPAVHLRGDVRYYVSFNDESVPNHSVLEDGRANLGLQFAFGYDPEAPEPQPVLYYGPGAEADSDGDGVADSRDRCPGTPPGVRVGADGCPRTDDADADGVRDAQDRCPGTPPGFAVDANGCVYRQTVVFRNINFDFNSAQLRPEGMRVLDEVAAGLRGQPSILIEIGGHASAEGGQMYNLRLSNERAASVRTYLASRGVDARRMTTEGYGEFKPIAPNETEGKRSLNRRVEFTIIRE